MTATARLTPSATWAVTGFDWNTDGREWGWFVAPSGTSNGWVGQLTTPAGEIIVLRDYDRWDLEMRAQAKVLGAW